MTEENGPFEVARSTHLLSKEEGRQHIEAGAARPEPPLLKAGDVMIRDVRGLHRGTPNRTDEPRPMVVVGYSRRRLFRPEVSIRIPRDALETLSERAASRSASTPSAIHWMTAAKRPTSRSHTESPLALGGIR